jgi:hypothetical protein
VIVSFGNDVACNVLLLTGHMVAHRPLAFCRLFQRGLFAKGLAHVIPRAPQLEACYDAFRDASCCNVWKKSRVLPIVRSPRVFVLVIYPSNDLGLFPFEVARLVTMFSFRFLTHELVGRIFRSNTVNWKTIKVFSHLFTFVFFCYSKTRAGSSGPCIQSQQYLLGRPSNKSIVLWCLFDLAKSDRHVLGIQRCQNPRHTELISVIQYIISIY